MDNQLAEKLILELTEVSRILSETSSQIAVNAVPLATSVELSANAAPRAPADVAAIAVVIYTHASQHSQILMEWERDGSYLHCDPSASLWDLQSVSITKHHDQTYLPGNYA